MTIGILGSNLFLRGGVDLRTDLDVSLDVLLGADEPSVRRRIRDLIARVDSAELAGSTHVRFRTVSFADLDDAIDPATLDIEDRYIDAVDTGERHRKLPFGDVGRMNLEAVLAFADARDRGYPRIFRKNTDPRPHPAGRSCVDLMDWLSAWRSAHGIVTAPPLRQAA